MIVFNNWQISVTGLIARQYDNLSRRIDVEGDLPAGYTWQLLVQCGGNADTILLEPTETGAGAVLTADNLSRSGEYYIQLRGVLKADGVTKRHTNVVSAYIPESLTGLGTWPEVPTEFAQVEARILELYQHPPIPGSNGYWLVWDTDKDEYVESQLALPDVSVGPQGPKGDKGDKGDPGPQGPKGDTGSDANVTAGNIESALGYTPASADHVTQLKEDLVNVSTIAHSDYPLVTDKIDVTNDFVVHDGKYIYYQDGREVALSNAKCSDFIDLFNHKIEIKVTTNAYGCAYALYDGNKNFIAQYGRSESSTRDVTTVIDYDSIKSTYNDARYARISTIYAPTFFIYRYKNREELYEEIQNKIKNNTSLIKEIAPDTKWVNENVGFTTLSNMTFDETSVTCDIKKGDLYTVAITVNTGQIEKIAYRENETVKSYPTIDTGVLIISGKADIDINAISINTDKINIKADGNLTIEVFVANERVLTVSKNGDKMFKSITDAVNYAKKIQTPENPITIMLYPGVYKEVVVLGEKNYISFIGVNKKDVIWRDDTGEYNNAPLKITGNFFLKNITFISTHDDNPNFITDRQYTDYRGYSYALHIDCASHSDSNSKKSIIEDCTFISKQCASVGIGMQKNDHMTFTNCEFIAEAGNEFGNANQWRPWTVGAFVVHPIDAVTNTEQCLEIRNCIFKSKVGNVMDITSFTTEDLGMTLTMIDNVFYSAEKGTTNIIHKTKNGDYETFEVTPYSFGNNITELNA